MQEGDVEHASLGTRGCLGRGNLGGVEGWEKKRELEMSGISKYITVGN
jgi:hypothetical protein